MQFIKELLHSKVAKNGLWLMVLQVFNTVVPLVTLPYITRVLGTTNYGFFSLALNWITYFQVIVEYGFGFSGTRKIALQEGAAIQPLFSRIMTARLCLLGLSYLAMHAVSFAVGVNEAQYVSMNILFLMIMGVAFQLTWLFQGMQDMKLITLINAASRLLSVIAVFLLVRSESHLYLYCFCYCATFILSALMGLILAKKKYGLRVRFCTIREAREELADGWHLFVSQAMAKIFGGVGITILGATAEPAAVGIYSALYKIPSVMILFFNPISQALYPYISSAYARSVAQGKRLLVKVSAAVIVPFACLGAVIIALRTWIVPVAFGADYAVYTEIIIPLILWAIFSILNNFIGIQYLVACGYQKKYSEAFTVSAVVTVVLNLVLGLHWGVYGISFAALFGEVILTAMLFLKVLQIKRYESL